MQLLTLIWFSEAVLLKFLNSGIWLHPGTHPIVWFITISASTLLEALTKNTNGIIVALNTCWSLKNGKKSRLCMFQSLINHAACLPHQFIASASLRKRKSTSKSILLKKQYGRKSQLTISYRTLLILQRDLFLAKSTSDKSSCLVERSSYKVPTQTKEPPTGLYRIKFMCSNLKLIHFS